MSKRKQYGFVLLGLLVFCLQATLALANAGGAEEPRWGDFAWRVLNFILFFGILWHFTGKLIKKYYAGRRQEIHDTLENLDDRRENARKRLSEVETRIANLDEERKAILNESRAQAEALKKKIIEDAQRQAEQIIAQAKVAAENEGRSALSRIRSTMADEIVEAAAKLLREKLGAEEHEKLIRNSLNKVVFH